VSTTETNDVVNGWLRRHYPDDWRNVAPDREDDPVGMRYQGRGASVVFPMLSCADGFAMSVQGHFGAYGVPRGDFAEHYGAVEIECLPDPALEAYRGGVPSAQDGKVVFGYVPVSVVAEVVARHGGLARGTSA
jgi:hypothetical protein